jgi:hypothetical protein
MGSSVPLLLRPRDNAGYQLIGEAYVHGIMQGEAMEWLRKGNCLPKDFDIY